MGEERSRRCHYPWWTISWRLCEAPTCSQRKYDLKVTLSRGLWRVFTVHRVRPRVWMQPSIEPTLFPLKRAPLGWVRWGCIHPVGTASWVASYILVSRRGCQGEVPAVLISHPLKGTPSILRASSSHPDFPLLRPSRLYDLISRPGLALLIVAP